jgi:hypothetical protein
VQLAVGSWQLAVGSWQLAVGSWQKSNQVIADCKPFLLQSVTFLLLILHTVDCKLSFSCILTAANFPLTAYCQLQTYF